MTSRGSDQQAARSGMFLAFVACAAACGAATAPGTAGGDAGAMGMGGAGGPTASGGAVPVIMTGGAGGAGGAGAGGGADAGDAGGEAGAAAALPCEVEAVLQARCRFCHTSPPRFGAPMALLTFENLHASAVSDTRKRVHERVRAEVEAGNMPPVNAPGGPLTADERATLLGWVAEGAPPGTGASCPAPAPGGPPAPEPGAVELPCEPDYEFRAHGADVSKPFPVPLADDHYACFAFQVPFTADEQAVAWGPLIDDSRVIHHWILYDANSTTKPVGCGQSRTFLMGWAPGGPTWVMPDDVGLVLPDPGRWLVLEAHYNNIARLPNAQDRSGVAVCTTKARRPKEAGVITFGTTRFVIPPDPQAEYPVNAECSPLATRSLPEPLRVLGTWPHMHTLGTRFRTDIIGPTGTRNLADVPRWDFNAQIGFRRDPAVIAIHPGDRVTTTCTYRNTTGRNVRFGERTEDEMCLNFTMVYPISAAAALDQVPLRLCNF